MMGRWGCAGCPKEMVVVVVVAVGSKGGAAGMVVKDCTTYV